MLAAIKEQLKTLASDPSDRFHFKVRERVGKKATQILEAKLKHFILLMPALISRIHQHWNHRKSKSGIKKLGGFLLAYLYHPRDFLSESEQGLFGYLDDAYLVAIVYEAVLEELSQSGNGFASTDEKLREEVKNLQRAAAIVIPKEAEKIKKMVGEVLCGKHETYLLAFQ
jgi:uncharacterized membrane protein YkvA (DUF1232 family)